MTSGAGFPQTPGYGGSANGATAASPARGDEPPLVPPFVLPPDVELTQGVVFAHPDGQELTLDLFLPKQRPAEPAPAVVWIHGGGWRSRALGGRVFWRQAAHMASLGVPG